MSIFNRRDFIRTGGVLAAGLFYLPACTSRMKDEASYRSLTLDEAMCVAALSEQIIPADDEFGGAIEAGVVFYIDRQLSGPLKEHAESYRENLNNLQVFCKKEFGKHFQNLASNEQIDVMERMESNAIGAGSWERPSDFFRLILSHTMQGYYGSPIHGGNKNYLSFNMLGLEYPLNIGQNRYRQPLHEL
jgi:gluconate 2-dehydrogenase gamma chain